MANLKGRLPSDAQTQGKQAGACISIDVQYRNRDSLGPNGEPLNASRGPQKRVSTVLHSTSQCMDNLSNVSSFDRFDGAEYDRRTSMPEQSEREKDIAIWETFSDIVPISHLQSAMEEFEPGPDGWQEIEGCGSTQHKGVSTESFGLQGFPGDNALCIVNNVWFMDDMADVQNKIGVEETAPAQGDTQPDVTIMERKLNGHSKDDRRKSQIDYCKPPKFIPVAQTSRDRCKVVSYDSSATQCWSCDEDETDSVGSSRVVEAQGSFKGFHPAWAPQSLAAQGDSSEYTASESSLMKQPSMGSERDGELDLENKTSDCKIYVTPKTGLEGAKIKGSTISGQRGLQRSVSDKTDKSLASPRRGKIAEAARRWDDDFVDPNVNSLPLAQGHRCPEDKSANSSRTLSGSKDLFASRDSFFGSMYDIVIPPSPLDAPQLYGSAEQKNNSKDEAKSKCARRTCCVPKCGYMKISLLWLACGRCNGQHKSLQRVTSNKSSTSDASQLAACQHGKDLYKRRHALLLNKMQAVLDNKHEKQKKRRSFGFKRPAWKKQEGDRKSKDGGVTSKQESIADSGTVGTNSIGNTVSISTDLDSANQGGVPAGIPQSAEKKTSVAAQLFPSRNVAKFIRSQHSSGREVITVT